MAYTTVDDPTLYFSTTTYTGDGNQNRAVTIDGTGMQPDWLWIKNRSAAEGHVVGDSVRGATIRLIPNDNGAEATRATNIASFTSTGFTVANGGVDGAVNTDAATYVSWAWKAGTAFTNDASATGIGSIDSSGSVNETAGFSIVSYTGSGSAATVKHGLSTTPNMMIIKNRPATDGRDWQVYSPVNDPTDALALNQTDPTGDSNVYWNDTAPTSSVFSVHSGATNKSGDATIGYIFSNRQGYSKFSSYTGNGNADGTFVYTGFKPAWVMIKRTDVANNWGIMDNKRSTFNEVGDQLMANTSDAEDNPTSGKDFLSNGFKLRETGNAINASGGTYIYMAFAENPFVTSTGIPTTAR